MRATTLRDVLTFFRPAARAVLRAACDVHAARRPNDCGGSWRRSRWVLRNPFPLDGGAANIPYARRRRAAPILRRFAKPTLHFVTPGYFETMRSRVILRTDLHRRDNTRRDQPSEKVVIDDIAAAQFYPRGDAVGRKLLIRNLVRRRSKRSAKHGVEIIGIVAHQRHETLTEPGREGIFFVDGYGASASRDGPWNQR